MPLRDTSTSPSSEVWVLSPWDHSSKILNSKTPNFSLFHPRFHCCCLRLLPLLTPLHLLCLFSSLVILYIRFFLLNKWYRFCFLTGSQPIHRNSIFTLTFYLVLVLLLFHVFSSHQINGYPSSHPPGFDSRHVSLMKTSAQPFSPSELQQYHHRKIHHLWKATCRRPCLGLRKPGSRTALPFTSPVNFGLSGIQISQL